MKVTILPACVIIILYAAVLCTAHLLSTTRRGSAEKESLFRFKSVAASASSVSFSPLHTRLPCIGTFEDYTMCWIATNYLKIG